MALRTKKIEYAFPTSTTSLASNTRLDFSAITIYIPETTSRTFLNVIIEINHQQNDAAGGSNVTSRLIGIKLGSASFDDVTRSEAIIEGFSTTSYRWTRDVTSYFNTNFGSGGSQTCQVGFNFNGQVSQSVTAKVIITYQFDDSDTTRVKTIKVPLESPTGMQTNTLTEIGTNQVPQLTSGGLIPEASPTIRAIWFELYGNQDTSGATTDFGLEASLDAEAGVAVSGTWEEGNSNYPNWFFVCWRRDDMSPTAAHAFKARTTTTGRVSNLCVMLCVTYEYDESSTSTVLCSLEMPMARLATLLGGSGSTAEVQRSQFKFMIEDPGTITLKQSAVMLSFNTFALQAANNLVRVGSQSYRTYTWGVNFSGNPFNGQLTQHHRIDSGGAQGAGITLARGENTLTLDTYMSDTDDAQAPFNVDAVAYINYTCDKHSLGSDAQTRTIRWLLRDSIRTSGSSQYLTVSATKPSISQPHYGVVAVGFSMNVFLSGTTKVFAAAEQGTGEGSGDGWVELIDVVGYNDENIPYTPYMDATRYFMRHPLEPSTTRMNLSRTRRFRVGMASQTAGLDATDFISDLSMYLTFSAMPLEVSRGVAPAVNGLTVNIYRADTKAWLYQAVTTATGGFSFVCHTDALTHFAETVSGTTYAGRSADFTPTGFSLNISWLPTSLSGLAIWLRADSGVTTAGGSVSAWTDGSGNSNNAAQGTAGNRPTNPLDPGDGLAAILFDGTNDQLEVTDASSFGSTSAFSVAAWVRTAATFPSDGTLVAQWGATERFIMRVATGGDFVVLLSAGTAGTGTVAAALATNTWYHLAFTYDGSGSGNSGKLKMYINGVQQTVTFSGTIPGSVGNPTSLLSIGSRNTASTYFNGHMDDIIFVDNRAMTQNEVITHYRYRPRFG